MSTRRPPSQSRSLIRPAALTAMAKMSAYLRSTHAFEVKMTTRRDDVDTFGQIITLDGETTYEVKSPDAFRIDQNEPARIRQYVYDGKSVTIFDPKSNVYASFPAPGTIRQTLDLAADKYGIWVPLDDLFHWDQGDAQTSKLTSAHYVGPTKVGGQDADQYAFRQPGVDWQIWIAKGDKPVPLRVGIVASDDPARPQFEANLEWNADPQFAADTFTFTAPANAKSIPIKSNER